MLSCCAKQEKHPSVALRHHQKCPTPSIQRAESRQLAHVISIAIRIELTEVLQIPIAQWKRPGNSGFDPAVSSPEYYLTPAPNADLIRKLLLVGRHLIILNKRRRRQNLLCSFTLTPLFSTTLSSSLNPVLLLKQGRPYQLS
jgi:hypothetical protein